MPTGDIDVNRHCRTGVHAQALWSHNWRRQCLLGKTATVYICRNEILRMGGNGSGIALLNCGQIQLTRSQNGEGPAT